MNSGRLRLRHATGAYHVTLTLAVQLMKMGAPTSVQKFSNDCGIGASRGFAGPWDSDPQRLRQMVDQVDAG